jgi:cell wall-associated NlpC family hydrolase
VASKRFARAARWFAAAGVLTAALTLVPAGAGEAAPNLSLSQVKARVAQLENEAEVADEKANVADIQYQQTQRHLNQVQHQVAAQQARLDKLTAQMGAYAAAMYANGGIDPSVQLMLSDNPSDFLAQAASLDQVARLQDSAFRETKNAGLQLASTKAEVNQQLAKLAALKKTADANRADVNDKLAQAKALLSRLTAAQQRRLAAQQAARNAAASQSSRSSNSGSNSGSSSGGSTYNPPPAGSGRGAIAVAYAMAQVGKPYVYGASGPSAYDCSGLTMMAWASAGVSMPHSASMQYAMTARVSLSQLQPGDLVFFYSDIHHVGMYIGGGNFVNAENPSVGIRVQNLYDPYWQSVYVGGGRV